IEPRFERYRLQTPITAGASTDAAIAAAAHATLSELVPSGRAALDAALRDSLNAVPGGPAKTKGVQIGRDAASAILAARKAAGGNAKAEPPPGTKPGEYRPTPPDFTPAWMAQWGQVTPFALEAAAQFRPSAPPAPGSAQALRDVAEVRELGAAEGSSRT